MRTSSASAPQSPSPPRPYVSLGSDHRGRATLLIGRAPVFRRYLERPKRGSVHTGWRRSSAAGVPKGAIVRSGKLPPYLEPRAPHHKCSICHGVKMHPVTSGCGHTHCFACLRVWLQTSWKCPVCMAVHYHPPVRNYDLEDWLMDEYPAAAADSSTVTYNWDSLVFPTEGVVLD
ncbi:hypothetical protein C8F01DRAFT_1136376 [Mycena amicta]|nr:hypothetical protein C8F01DRAFT_1142359 [Mycena amicta]KAJ7062092.1 hypothetical protein C8F01DRAFT_1136376 [Mycena amicta]